MATPTLALIPTGYKAGKLYSVLPESGVGDFTVVRATEATRVNEEGLIETMGANVPRLDYSGGGCPVLLTEPQRTNIWTNSNLSASISLDGLTRTLNQGISPSGNNDATLFNETATTGTHRFYRLDIPSTSTDFSMSFFARKNGINIIRIVVQGGTKFADFDLSLGTVGNESGINSSTIEDYGNGWYRCIINVTASGWVGLYALNDSSQNSYLGDVSKGVYLYGAQLELGSYSTSLINTSGSAVTRNGDQVTGAGDAATFNDSEGVLMAEISALNNTVSTYNSIGLGSGSIDNRMGLGFEAPSNIYVYKRSGSGWLPKKTVDITSLNKVALSYNTNDNHFWLNGFKLASNTTIGDIGQPTELEFEASYGLEEFYGNTKQVQYFNTALTDSELEKLTSWTSFIEMAQAQNYNII